MTQLSDSLSKVKKSNRKAGPLWTGPCGAGPQGGVTQGLIGKYLTCKERFRIATIEGLKPADSFNSRIEFGNMWHAMEEAHASCSPGAVASATCLSAKALVECAQQLSDRYPLDRAEIALWHDKAAALFPLYIDHWAKHPDVVDRTPLMQEQVFDVPYQLPSGRTVRLRGKWDGVSLIGKGKAASIWLDEHKSKGTIDQEKLMRQLAFDLQTMTYLITLQESEIPIRDLNKPFPGYDPATTKLTDDQLRGLFKKVPIAGVRYNCIRRPAHKSVDSMLDKIGLDARNGRAAEWWCRWNVEVAQNDVERFRRECLDPILDNLCDDYEWWSWCAETKHYQFDGAGLRFDGFKHHQQRHFRMPFGIYNPLLEAGNSELDSYLATGSKAGLKQNDNLFPELT